MRSRLDAIADAGASSSNDHDGINDAHLHMVSDVERQDTDVEREMSDFIELIGTARKYVQNIEASLSRISETHEQALSAISEAQKGENQRKANELTSVVQRDGNKVRCILKDIAKDIKSNNGTDDYNSPLARLRRSQHAALSAKFFDAMNEYNEIQRLHKTKMRTMLSRQLRIAKPDASEDEVNKFLEAGDINPFSISTTRTMEVKKALEDVNERHKELLKLEQSISELQALFVDMAAMVEQQGALIDQIDFNVSEAVTHTNKGTEVIKQASALQKKARRCYIYIFVAISVIALIIILGLVLHFKPWEKEKKKE